MQSVFNWLVCLSEDWKPFLSLQKFSVSTRLSCIATIMATARGPLWRGSVLPAEPIRAPCGKATQNNSNVPAPLSLNHTRWNARLFTRHREIKTTTKDEGVEEQHSWLPAVIHHPIWLEQWRPINPLSHFHSFHYSLNFIPLRFPSFFCILRGGWASRHMGPAWIDFCFAHFSWFWLRRLQAAPDEGPLGLWCSQVVWQLS